MELTRRRYNGLLSITDYTAQYDEDVADEPHVNQNQISDLLLWLSSEKC